MKRRTPSSITGVPALTPPRTNGIAVQSEGAEAEGDIETARSASVSRMVGSMRITAVSTTNASLDSEIGLPGRPRALTTIESIGTGARRNSTSSSPRGTSSYDRVQASYP